MDVCLGAFDVIVKVVSEQVNEVNGVIASVLVRMSRKQDEGDVADAVADSGVCTFESSWRVSTEKNLRGGGTRSTTFFELLENY